MSGETEEEKRNFQIDPKIINAIIGEIMIEFTNGAAKVANQ